MLKETPASASLANEVFQAYSTGTIRGYQDLELIISYEGGQ